MLKIASKPENISKLDEALNELKNKFDLDERTYMNIHLSLTEAVNNAIIHGNCKDCSKYVSINVLKKENKLTLFVKDEGSGFDYECLPDPLSEENLEREGGRGVFLIRQLCDNFSYQNNGSTLKMSFVL